MYQLLGGKNQSMIINADKTENLYKSSASGCRGRPEWLQKPVKMQELTETQPLPLQTETNVKFFYQF